MAHPELIHHNQTQFKKSVIELCPYAWSAVGFAASTQHMIEGKSSVTIIDTSESTQAAENVFAEFKLKSDKPIERIVYTHSHRDHISGASVFAQNRDVPIYAGEGFASDLVGQDKTGTAPIKALHLRTQAQFGIGLTPEQRVSLGCGPGERPMQGLGAGYIAPTHFISQDTVIDFDGVEAHLIRAPGETDDHIAVWLPESRILIPGDNWYHAFPNLYAIRGTPYRDFQVWADTLSLLEKLDANVLAPGHTMPVFGREAISEVLSTTRQAILHVMKHTADGMNAGMSVDDIAATVTMPAAIRDKPWLGEFYGKAAWSVRAYAAGTLGWYDGNPSNLGTLSTLSRAQKMAKLVGGNQELNLAAQNTDDLQWCLELCDHLLALGEPVELLKATTMETLAETEINATARNTYLWEAKRLRELVAAR